MDDVHAVNVGEL